MTEETLREAEIRPEHLMAEQARLFAEDVERLRAQSDRFVHRPCPACATDAPQPEFQKLGIEYVSCQACGTLYVDPRPAPAVLAEYYRTSRNYRFWAEHIFPASEEARRDRIFAPRLARLNDLCERNRIARDVLLEVGPGFGTFSALARGSGGFARVIAVEPTPWLAEHCRERGVEVLETSIENVQLESLPTPNVIAAFEVIEHLFAPDEFVSACVEILPQDGLLVLTCPSGAGFDVMELGPESDTVDAEHLNYFTPDSLASLVERCGLRVVEVSTPGQLDAELVRRKALEGRWDSSRSPFLRKVLLDQWQALGGPFQAFLSHHGLSSHLWLAATGGRA